MSSEPIRHSVSDNVMRKDLHDESGYLLSKGNKENASSVPGKISPPKENKPLDRSNQSSSTPYLDPETSPIYIFSSGILAVNGQTVHVLENGNGDVQGADNVQHTAEESEIQYSYLELPDVIQKPNIN